MLAAKEAFRPVLRRSFSAPDAASVERQNGLPPPVQLEEESESVSIYIKIDVYIYV